MPLVLAEIAPGAVAYFDPDILLEDHRVGKPPYPAPRRGRVQNGPVTHPLDPFICVEADSERSTWAPLTHQEKVVHGRQVRLPIPPTYRSGSKKWLGETIFLNDGASTYVGPHESFIAAASREAAFTAIPRPQILPAGIANILNEVAARGGRRLATVKT